MPNTFKDLAAELEQEVETDKQAAMTEQERIMLDTLRDILSLNRAMTQPGSAVQDATRVERLTRFIEGRNF
jgi:hypothetical protein